MTSNGDTLAMKQSPSPNPFAVVVEHRPIVKAARRVGVFYWDQTFGSFGQRVQQPLRNY
jgi:hypothetical protein